MTMKLEEVASFVEKSEDEMLKDTYNRLRIELVQLHERIDSESQVTII